MIRFGLRFAMVRPRPVLAAIALMTAVIAVAPAARADVLFDSVGTVAGKAVSASATFSLDGNVLQIVLQNTGLLSTYTPGTTLTDVAFNTTTNNTVFDPSSADSTVKVAPGSVLGGSSLTDISSEWGLGHNVSLGLASNPSTSVNLAYEITATSSGDANSNLFGTGDLGGGNKLGGSDFGLVNAASASNPSISGKFPVVDSVVIRIVMTSHAITDLSQITDVYFSYGTGNDHVVVPSLPPGHTNQVPTPAALPAGAALLLGLAARRRRIA